MSAWPETTNPKPRQTGTQPNPVLAQPVPKDSTVAQGDGKSSPPDPNATSSPPLPDTLNWAYESESALAHLFKRADQQFYRIWFDGSLADLARAREDLEFPGIDGVDAAFWHNGCRYWVRTADTPLALPPGPLSIRYQPQTRRIDSGSQSTHEYRSKTWQPDPAWLVDSLAGTGHTAGHTPSSSSGPEIVSEIAIFASRHLSAVDPAVFTPIVWPHNPRAEVLRRTLELVVTGPHAHLGLQILYNTGWIDTYLPELRGMHDTQHSKEEHPEGDVWVHSLETLKYRKTLELDLSLGLLLHDCGKPDAKPRGNRVFDGHAEIGADKARTLMRRLDFAPTHIQAVCWLVENHMMPQALSILPLYRTEKLMGHDLFPVLLELYRCDLVSTWRGPDGYYDACTRFRAWLKASRNPWISLDRKRLIQRFVASSHD